jgi:hypothetical protein
MNFENKKLIITIAMILLLSIFASFYIYLIPKEPEELIENEIIYVSDRTGFKNYTYPIQVDSSLPNSIVVLNQYSSVFQNLILTLVFNGYPSEETYQRVWIFELERKGVFSNDYTIIRRQGARIYNLTFIEVVNLVSKYDISKEFPGKENYNVTNYEPLTPEELELAKQHKENQEQLESLIAKENREREIATNPQLPEDLETLKGLVEKYYAIAEDETNFLLPNEREEYRQEAERIKQVIDEYEKN